MIHIKNMSKIYNKGNEDEVSALKDVSIEIPQGEFVIIIGTNGSGKSTMLNLLLASLTLFTTVCLACAHVSTCCPLHAKELA